MSNAAPGTGRVVRAIVGAVAAGVTAAAATRAVRAWSDALSGPDDPRWARTNHRGEPVSLLEGPAVAAGLLAGVGAAGLVGAGLAGAGPAGAGGGADRARACLAAGVAVAGGAAFGLVDDLSEDQQRRRKGLRGHLGALARGELTTGGLKVVGIGLASLAAAAVAPRSSGRSSGRAACGVGRLGGVVVDGALIAGSANLVNLFDLRPGRALKVGLLAAPTTLVAGAVRASGRPGAGSRSPSAGPATAAAVGAAVLGAAGAALGPDLAERDMLGDGGANALGAAIGVATVLGCSRRVRLGLLAAVVGLTLASEKVSFTRVIERTAVLRRIDEWGRRPVDGVSSAPEDPPT